VSPSFLPRRAAFRAATAVVVILAPFLLAAELHDGPPPLPIVVDGQAVLVRNGATLGETIRMLQLHPAPGRLLDVEGQVLDPRADPGAVLLNGTEAPRSVALTPEDRIEVIDGTDTTEGTDRLVRRSPGRQPGNPMYTLATSKVEQTTVTGRVSGKVVSIRYRAIGRQTEPPAVALTFDDGPWPGDTRKVLNVLQRLRVPATFFMVGYLMERYPDIVERVHRAGMTIGTHSWSHPYLTPFKDLAPHRMETEVTRPAELLQTRFQIRPTLFRPPGGTYDPRIVQTAQQAGMHLALWSVDPHDYLDSATPKRIARDVLRAVQPGSIVLLHDGGGDQSATIHALPRIVRGIRHMGLELVALPS
jgi:peptidoglycan/xylan/chitin deacetylase (PgdA/CDA1 family)